MTRDDLQMDELFELTERQFEGTATADDMRRLSALLAKSEANRARYLAHLQLHGEMHWQTSGAAHRLSTTQPAPQGRRMTSVDERRPGASTRLRIAYALAAAIALSAAAVAVYVIAFSDSTRIVESGGGSRPLATLIESSGGTLTTPQDYPQEGREYTSGTYSLDGGSAQFVLTNHVSVNLHGKTRLHMHSDMHATLDHGAVSFDCPPQAKGYTVDTSTGVSVVDLGTAFTLSIDTDRQTTVRVTEGRIECSDADGAAHRLDAGTAIAFDTRGRFVYQITFPDRLDVVADYRFDSTTGRPLGIGPALSPIATGGYATRDAAMTDTDNWMLEAVVRADDINHHGAVVYNGHSGTSGYGIVQRGEKWAVVYGVVDIFVFDAPVTPGRLVHLAAARFDGEMRFYVDGEPIGPAIAVAPRPVHGSLFIGGNPDFDDEKFPGAIQRVRASRLTAPLDPAVFIRSQPITSDDASDS